MIAKLFLILAFLAVLPSGIGLYSIHITGINGQDKTMSDFAGKKLLIIVLPVTASSADSQYLERVGRVSQVYADSLNVIGVPAYEFGFTSANQSAIAQRYTSLTSSRVFIT